MTPEIGRGPSPVAYNGLQAAAYLERARRARRLSRRLEEARLDRWTPIRDPRLLPYPGLQTAIAIGDVKQASSSTSSAQSTAFASSPATGDLIVVVVKSWGIKSGGSDYTTNAPTDTAGNTYVQAGSTISHSPSSNAHNHLSFWYAKNITGGATFRVTATVTGTTGTVGVTIVAIWVTGADTTAPYNSDFTSATNTGTAVTTGTPGVTPPANSLAVGAMGNSGGGATITDGTGWNSLDPTTPGLTSGMVTAGRQTSNSEPPADLYVELKIVSAATAATWTSSSSTRTHLQGVVSFQPAAAGGGASISDVNWHALNRGQLRGGRRGMIH